MRTYLPPSGNSPQGGLLGGLELVLRLLALLLVRRELLRVVALKKTD